VRDLAAEVEGAPEEVRGACRFQKPSLGAQLSQGLHVAWQWHRVSVRRCVTGGGALGRCRGGGGGGGAAGIGHRGECTNNSLVVEL